MKTLLAALALAFVMALGSLSAPAEAKSRDHMAQSDNDEGRQAKSMHRKRHMARHETRRHGKRHHKAAAHARHGKTKRVARAHHARPRIADKDEERPAKRRRAASEERSHGGGGSNAGSGVASVYWEGSRTANGEHFNPDGMTAAHRSLPFGTRVRVTNASTGRAVVVRINDRGPFIGGRVIDLSRGAARAVGISGLGRVNMQVLGR